MTTWEKTPTLESDSNEKDSSLKTEYVHPGMICGVYDLPPHHALLQVSWTETPEGQLAKFSLGTFSTV